MGVGELKKRIKKLDETSDEREGSESPSYYGGYETACYDILDVVDEAKKEFPILPFETQLTHEVLLDYACDRANWFFKWFGKGDLEKTSTEKEKTMTIISSGIAKVKLFCPNCGCRLMVSLSDLTEEEK